MNNDQPTGNNRPEDSKSNLPPRADDWRSGLNREDGENRRRSADKVNSEFLKNRPHNDSPDWDPVNDKTAGPDPKNKGATVPVNDNIRETRKTEGPAVPIAGEEATRVAPPPPVSAEPPLDSPPPKHEGIEYFSRPSRFSDLIIALLLAVVAFFAVAGTYHGFGHSWDEALYLKPSERAASWMLGVINSGDDSMLQRDAIDRHWGQYLDGRDPLHPEIAPIPKLLTGAGLTYLQKPLNIGPMMASRLPFAILFGLTVALLYMLGSKEYGRIGGFAAALFYILMPRIFGHAHIAASETALAFFTVLTVWCFLVGNRFWPFALFTGIAFGLAVDTKISALMLPIPLIVWGQIYKRRQYASNMFAMLFIAPLVIVALWPWLWYDGLKRFFAYILFYADHQQTAVFYMNRLWGYSRPSAPFYYGPHIAALSLPIWVLFFLAVGLLRALFSTVRRPATILFVFVAVAWMGLSMLPGAPRYDGVRLFFPCFAFVSLIAAGGFSALFVGVRGWRERRAAAGSQRETSYIAAIALFIVAVYGVVDLYFTHPNEINYYNWIVGRTSGAYKQGFETSYWGEGVNEDVVSYLNNTLKPGDKVKTLALNELAFEDLRDWGKLPSNVDFAPTEPPYDYVVMQVRQGFMGPVEHKIMATQKPLKTFSANGVPRIVVYDGKTMNDIFPESKLTPKPENSIFDGQSTSTVNIETKPTGMETSSPISMDETLTSAPATKVEAAVTTSVPVLDLPTSASETTATADRMTTMPAIELMTPTDIETSAPGTYEGDLPATVPVMTVNP